jgi:hypothetical protein
LERLERSQRPGVFLVNGLAATPSGVMLMSPSGLEVVVPVNASTAAIGEALRRSIPDLRIPDADEDPGISAEPDVQVQWAQLHYALGAYETAILADAQVHVLAVERHGSSATVRIMRGPDDAVETYSIDLNREIDIGLADTLAFAPAYGLVNGSLNQP